MNREEMLEYIPHRGRNLLIDDYEDTGEMRGRGLLRIGREDPDGRSLFLVHGPDGLRYSHFFLVEHAALASVLILRAEMGGGRLAYFSTISRFAARSSPSAGVPLVSHVSRGRDRGEFRSFTARVETEAGEHVLDVGFMAFLAPRGIGPEERPAVPHQMGFPPPEPGGFPGLHPSLVFLSRFADGESGGAYPSDHPLCDGHFPGAPVMMGMTQWLAVAQCAALTAPTGESVAVGSGALRTADGRPVAEVAGLEVGVSRDDEGRVRDLRLLATKRVAFRDRILPGDGYLASFTPA